MEKDKKAARIAYFTHIMHEEWHPTKNIIDKAIIRPMSGKVVWWMCSKGHEWDERVDNRVVCMSGCPYCSGHRIMPGENDLATQRPDVAALWHPKKMRI